MAYLGQLKAKVSHLSQGTLCLLIFVTCIFVYLANNSTLSSGDNVPSTLIAFNWLFNHTLHLDVFRNSYLFGPDGVCTEICDAKGIPYFFTEAPNGHLTSTYPIGNSILTFPLYFLFFLYLKLHSLLQTWISGNTIAIPALTDPAFEVYRAGFEKLAAAIATSLSVVIFYLCASLKFSVGISLTTTFVYAFATTVWITNSQALSQHSAENLALVSLMLCLLKANRASGHQRRVLLILVGVFCGLIPGIRPTSVFFSIAATIYAGFAYRRDAIFLMLGLPSFLLNAGWNFYYFGFGFKTALIGGYSRFSSMSFEQSVYRFTPSQFREGFVSLLFSPNRGFFVYSPVLLFSGLGLYPVFRHRFRQDEQLIGCLTIASSFVFIQYCFYILWWGGWGYGPRFLTDILPIICYLICYALAVLQHHLIKTQKYLARGLLSIFLILALFSTTVQAVGVFGRTNWDAIPGSNYPGRLWDWQDTQIKRYANSIVYKVAKPIRQPKRYLRKTDGIITQISDANNLPITTPITAAPAQELALTATLQNTGQTRWYGYQTGMGRGEIRVEVKFLNSASQAGDTGPRQWLYASGITKPGKQTQAIGIVLAPVHPGTYRMVLEPSVYKVGAFPRTARSNPYEIQMTVQAA
jgi:hypothetical protein